MFTQEEAQAFLVAEKIFEKVTDKGSSEHFHSAMLKIKAVLKTTEKDRLDQLSPQVEVIQMKNYPQADKNGEFLQSILNSLSNKKLLEIHYTTFEEETSSRIIEPVGVYYAFEQWYLIAWCRLRADYRTFRIDRIQNLKTLEETYETDVHPTLKEYLKEVRAKENLTQIDIWVPFSSEKYLREQKYNQGYVNEGRTETGIEMTFMTSSVEGFVRWIIMMGDKIKLLSPPEAKDRMKELVEEIRLNL